MRSIKTSVLLMPVSLLIGSSPPPAMTSCTPGPYIVFFERNQAFLDREARETLDYAIENMNNCGPARATISGHVDTSERRALAAKRNHVVIAYLAAHGLPKPDIKAKAFGSRRPRVETAKGVEEQQNRRVEILYGPF